MSEYIAKLDVAIAMLLELGKGNFGIRAKIDGQDDLVNTMLSGLNMLSEELRFYKEQLDQKNELLHHTFYNISELVYVIQPQSSSLEDIRFEFLSPRIETLFGYLPEDLYEQPSLWLNVIHPGDIQVAEQALSNLLNGNETICQFRMRHRAKTNYFWMEHRMTPKNNANDRYVEIFCSARDITESKLLLEERGKLINDLNGKISEMMQFNYIISHNLRSSVVSILGATKLFQLGLTDSEITEVHDVIHSAASRLDEILKDLNLLLSAKSKVNEKYEAFNLRKTLNGVLDLLKESLTDAKINLTINIDDTATALTSIKSYIHSALYNLIANAIKYRNTTVTPEITVKAWRLQNYLYLQVSDNGIGIDMEKHGGEVFNIYRRFNENFEGKGLGLHMTKVQIESLGGTINVNSVLGKGSVFTIKLKT